MGISKLRIGKFIAVRLVFLCVLPAVPQTLSHPAATHTTALFQRTLQSQTPSEFRIVAHPVPSVR